MVPGPLHNQTGQSLGQPIPKMQAHPSFRPPSDLQITMKKIFGQWSAREIRGVAVCSRNAQMLKVMLARPISCAPSKGLFLFPFLLISRSCGARREGERRAYEERDARNTMMLRESKDTTSLATFSESPIGNYAIGPNRVRPKLTCDSSVRVYSAKTATIEPFHINPHRPIIRALSAILISLRDRVTRREHILFNPRMAHKVWSM